MSKLSTTAPGASENATSPSETISVVEKTVAKKAVTKKPAVAKKTVAKPAAKKPVAKPVAKKPVAKPVAKKPAAKKGKPAKRVVDNSKRDHSKVKVNGVVLTKGRAVLTMVQELAPKKTLAELRTSFPDEMIKNYGVIQPIKEAGKRANRFYMKKEDLITTKDGKIAAVCSQLSLTTIKPIIAKAKTMGLTVSIVPAK